MAKRRFVSANIAAEILGCTPLNVTVLARRWPEEFAPVIQQHGKSYFLPSVLEKFKKSNRLRPENHPKRPDEIWA